MNVNNLRKTFKKEEDVKKILRVPETKLPAESSSSLISKSSEYCSCSGESCSYGGEQKMTFGDYPKPIPPKTEDIAEIDGG